MLLKFKKKSRTNKVENRQKIKNSQSQLKIYWFRKIVYFDLFTFEKFWILKLLLTWKFTSNNLKGACRH